MNLENHKMKCNPRGDTAPKEDRETMIADDSVLRETCVKRVTRRQANSVVDKILEQPVGKNCRKMRRYRGNVRNDPERLEKMGALDRERKRLTREAQRQEIQKSNRQSEVCLREKREYKREHILKRKKENSQRTKIQPDKQMSKPLLSMKRNEMKEKRAKMLKKTPKKRAAIVEKITELPTISKILEKRGKLMSIETSKKLKLTENVCNSISCTIQENNGKQNMVTKTATNARLTTAVKAIGQKYKVTLSTLSIPMWKMKTVHKSKGRLVEAQS